MTDDYWLGAARGNDIVPDPKRRFQRAVLACALLGPLSLLLPIPCSADSYSDNLGRRYSLTGSLELSYDRRSSQGVASGDFRQLLLLDHRGFVADPQLLTYEISGRVSHDAGKGSENTTVVGTDLGLTLFRSLPRGLQKGSDYIPHPIWLRYSRESDNLSDYTSYGLSFSHSVSQKQRFLEWEDAPKPGGDTAKTDEKSPKPDGKSTKTESEDADLYEDGPARTMKIVEKDSFPFPVTFFDYDHVDQKSQGSHTVNDTLSLRSSLTGKSYDYRFLYENQNQTGSQVLQRSLLQFEPIYRFYNEETKRQIDIRNILRYEEYNRAQNIELGSNFNWSRPIGKDELSVRSELDYSSSSAARLTEANYNATASANYKKFISPRLTNSTSLLTSFKKRDSVDTSASIARSNVLDDHSERLLDTVTADISQLYSGVASAYVGNGVQGTEYGTSATLSTKTRITTFLSYSYNLSAPQMPASSNLVLQSSLSPLQQSSQNPPTQNSSGRMSKNEVTVGASGPLLNNLAFQTRADFALSEVPVVGGKSTEEAETLSGNLLWRLPKTAMTLGGNYSQMKKADSASSSTSLFSTITRVLPMRMLFNFYSTWTKTDSNSTGAGSNQTTRLELRPTLRWTRGLTTVDTEYSYTRSTGGGDTSVDQRFFARLVRKFSALF